MSEVKFTETVFAPNGKRGIITPDENGYYTLVIGGLNTYNSIGEYYIAKGAEEALHKSSSFQRRVANGFLYSEFGHPKWENGMSYEKFYSRILQIHENNVCAHISEVWLDYDYGKNHSDEVNPEFIAIMGKVAPFGEKGHIVKSSLENPKQNSAFSIRGLTENKEVRGRTERSFNVIVTFDFVLECGVKPACKAHAPGLESFVTELADNYVDRAIMLDVIDRAKRGPTPVATESGRIILSEVEHHLKAFTTNTKLRSW